MDAKAHYGREDVRREILEFSRGRWCAVASGSGLFSRYWPDGSKIFLSSRLDYERLLSRLPGARSIYASVAVYGSGGSVELATPFWDIDGSLETVGLVLKAARSIVGFLRSRGVEESVYLLWSGEGVHVRISEKAFSESLLREHGALGIAYAVVEHVVRSLRKELVRVWEESGRTVKVESLIDPARVFTVPLSLHRRRDLVAVTFGPEQISDFNLSWANPDGYKHNPDAWRRAVRGEADSLAEEAVKAVGARLTERTRLAVRGGRIGRFQVMALLQAARYYVLTGDLARAKSFGLNRAIFYAWAKHYGPRGPGIDRRRVRRVEGLGESAPVSEGGWFTMGGREQRPEDYDREVAAKISVHVPYQAAWSKAVEYVSSFPESVLRDQQRFYKEVYLPVRDRFLELVRGERKKGLDELLGAG